MDDDRRATSILEFLTTKNPVVDHLQPNSKTNTRDWQYHFPKQLKKWDGFTFEILKEIEGGKLFEAARREGVKLPHYPTISPRNDTRVKDEPSTRKLIEKWSETMVTAALDCIQGEFNPAVWMLGQNDQLREYVIPAEQGIERVVPPRQSSARARPLEKPRRKKLYPDSGAVSANSTLDNNDPGYDAQYKERFPKEYKVGMKWFSNEFFTKGMVNANGNWTPGAKGKNYAMPIGQAYSYCLDRLCRYGCILTCYEAFIFRVTPQDEATNKTLTEGLIENGLMEWVSIPWSNHCEGNLDEHATWTVNLALWFMHVLVGRHYEVAWEYKDLESEELAVPPSPVETSVARHDEVAASAGADVDADARSVSSNHTDDTTEAVISPAGRKRKRSMNAGLEEEVNEEAEDRYKLSFAEPQSFTTSLAQLV